MSQRRIVFCNPRSTLGARYFDLVAALKTLAEILGAEELDTRSSEHLAQTSRRLRNAYGVAATKFIVEKASDFCRQKDKKLMTCILCPTATKQLLNNQPRYDQEIADHLAEAGRGSDADKPRE